MDWGWCDGWILWLRGTSTLASFLDPKNTTAEAAAGSVLQDHLILRVSFTAHLSSQFCRQLSLSTAKTLPTKKCKVTQGLEIITLTPWDTAEDWWSRSRTGWSLPGLSWFQWAPSGESKWRTPHRGVWWMSHGRSSSPDIWGKELKDRSAEKEPPSP